VFHGFDFIIPNSWIWGFGGHFTIFNPLIETTMAKTRITVNSNGSLRVEGDFEIVDKNGNVYDLGGREVVSLCRCGLSKNKPFCDASHKGHLEHEAVAFSLPPKK
jgi:CDGSH-type Zn-finger protein